MKPHAKPAVSIELLYVIGIIAISFSSIFVRWSDAPVSVIAMYRLLLTDALLLPLAWKYRSVLFQLSSRQWLGLFASGAMLGLHFLLWMASLRYTSVASSTVILTLEPIMVMAASFFLYRIRANRMMIIGMMLAALGSVVIGSEDFHYAGKELLGDMLSFFGTVAVAVHMLFGKKLRERMDAFPYNFWVFLFAASTLAVYNVGMKIPFVGYEAKEWGVFLLLAIVPTLFGHYLFNWLLKYLQATAVSMAVLGEPVFASLLAWLLLGERLSALQLGAGILILFGVWLFIRYGQVVEHSMPRRSRKASAGVQVQITAKDRG